MLCEEIPFDTSVIGLKSPRFLPRTSAVTDGSVSQFAHARHDSYGSIAGTSQSLSEDDPSINMHLRPRLFGGEEDGEDVEGWLLHFESICAVNGRDNDSQKIALLSVSTTGAATSWSWTNTRWVNVEGQSWEEVKERFLEPFEDQDIEEKIYAYLKTP